MKRKVAVFANGWSNEYLELTIEGMRKRAKEENIDLYVFVNYSAGEDDDERDNIGERGMFTLPDLGQFDGVVLFGNIINMEWERAYLRDEILKNRIPAVCFEYEMEQIPFLETDTYQGIFELVNHVIEVHHAKKILYVNGPKHNKECIIRRKAIEDALEKKTLALREEDVIYAEWSYQLACANMKKWIHEHNELPDAIICANDEMAMGICTALNDEGIEVPGQIIVTGCDFVADGQRFFPMLSTVKRDWNRLGSEGMELLLNQMNGQDVPLRTRIPCTVELGESCGCCASDEKCKRRLQAVGESYRSQRQGEMDEWHLRFIDDALSKITDSQSLKESMQGNFEANHRFEGDNFMICLEENFFSTEDKLDNAGRMSGWMETYVHLRDGKNVPVKSFPVGQILPNRLEEEGTHIYLFVGLHEFEHCFGYIVQKDFMDRLYDKTLYSWVQRISQDMLKVKQNIRLEDLNRRLVDVSITDKLTGLKNRTGFEMKAMPYLQKCKEDRRVTMMVFADIDQMKVINDQFGHLQGDMALCIVAEAIKQTIPKEWIAIRYGGDEFIVVGACDEINDINEISGRFMDNLNRLKQRNALAFPLSVSLGAAIMRPDEMCSLDEYMHRADAAMYAEKKKYHKNM